MNRKLLLALVATLGAGLVPSFAQTAPTLTLTPSVVSQYMFRGQRLGGPSFQPAVEYGDGPLTLGVWSNFPITDKVAGVSDPEFDFYGSYTYTINDAVTIVPGFTDYFYPHASTGAGFYKNTFEGNIALNYTYQGVKFTPKAYYDIVLKAYTLELSLSYAIPLKDIGSEIDLVGTYGTYKGKDFVKDSNPDTKGYGDYWLVGASMPFQVTKTSKITFGLAYTEGDNSYFKQGSAPKSVNTLAIGRAVASVSYAIGF